MGKPTLRSLEKPTVLWCPGGVTAFPKTSELLCNYCFGPSGLVSVLLPISKSIISSIL